MKRLRSTDDLDSFSDKNAAGESHNSDRPASSSHRGFFHKSFSRKGPISPSTYDRDRQPFVSGNDAGFSKALSRRRSTRDFAGGFDHRRKEPNVRYREDRLYRSESACFSKKAFPKGFRSERERPNREASVSSWRRFGGPGNDFGVEERERGSLNSKFRDGERERSVRSPTWSRDSADQLKLKLDSRNSRSRSKSLASPTWSKDSGSEQSKSVGNVVKKSEEKVLGKNSRSSSEIEEGELEPEPLWEAASGASHTRDDSKESFSASDDHMNARIDCSFRKIKKDAEFDDCVRKVKTECNKDINRVSSDREVETAEGMVDKKSEEKGENVTKYDTELCASENVVNDSSTGLASERELRDDRSTAVVSVTTEMADDKKENEENEENEENHGVKWEESGHPAVPEQFQEEELKHDAANKAEGEAPECVEGTALGNRTTAEYMSLMSDSSTQKCEDKGKSFDVPSTHVLGNVVISKGKSENLTGMDKDEADNIVGPSIRGFELFSSSPVRKSDTNELSGVNKPKDEKLMLEPLDLSLSLPDVLLPIGGKDTNQPLGSPVCSGSVRSLTDTFCTNSDGFTMSMSFSGSRSFNHNPSCSLNHNAGDNEQSVHSRPIFQGIDWQAMSHDETRYNENTVYRRMMENGIGSDQPQAIKGMLIPGQAAEECGRLTDGSSKAINGVEKQLSFQKSGDVSISWISSLETGRDDFVETVIKYILSDSMHVMTKRFYEMPARYIASLKERILQMMLDKDKHVQLGAFQDALQNRTDITLELLTKSHRAQLEILVALKIGRSDLLQLGNNISSSDLAEIFMNMRCKNLACRGQVPVDECDCRICSRKDGFCSACMCLVCSNFDMASNTCSWVGCDVCLHWCHTDCGIRESYIRNGNNASGSTGMTEMQFHCVACDHPSEMFGFVKEVFLNFARDWKFERFCKELEYVQKIFLSSKDSRGKQLKQAADVILASLKSKSIDLSDACNRILGFLSDCDFSAPAETAGPFRNEQPKPRHERVVLSEDTAWLRSVYSDKPNHQLKGSASVADAFQRKKQTVICAVEAGLKKGSPKEPHFEELESIVRMKQAEAEMFQGRADEARKEAEGLRRIAIAKKEKIEEEYKKRMVKLNMEEAEERRSRKYEELEAMERGQREFYEMRMRMEEEMRGLLTKMELTKQRLAL